MEIKKRILFEKPCKVAVYGDKMRLSILGVYQHLPKDADALCRKNSIKAHIEAGEPHTLVRLQTMVYWTMKEETLESISDKLLSGFESAVGVAGDLRIRSTWAVGTEDDTYDSLMFRSAQTLISENN